METQDDIHLLIRKYLQQQCTVAEINVLLNLFGAGKNEQQLKAAITEYMEAIDETLLADNYNPMLGDVESMLLNRIQEVRYVRRMNFWPRWVAAASIVVAVMVGGYFYYNSQLDSDNSELLAANDIAPGKNGATLTLGNGKKILLKDALAGNIAIESGAKISKTADGQIVYEVTGGKSGQLAYNTLTTTRGEQAQLRLPDGTLVYLNSESALRYPTSFTKSDRRMVSLEGEGFFNVSKDKKHPFIVKTGTQEVEVLGTQFNINSYSDEYAIKTTLIEGSVNITVPNSKNSKVLIPGQQAIVKGNDLKIGDADVDQAVSWKNGDFVFVGEDLKAVMRQVARWYDVEIEYQGNINSSGVVSTISRTKKLSQVLKALQINQGIHFKVEGRRVLVMP